MTKRIMVRSICSAILVSFCIAGSACAQTGKWIWQSANSSENTWMCFRRTISLPQAPSSAIIKIAVDSKYWLWVNGIMTVFEGGLKRGPNPDDTYYDEIDIGQYLSSGENTIAVLVWFFGKDGFSHKNSGMGGLWIESTSAGLALATDATWKVRQHPAYGTVGGDGPNYRLAESWVSFDARNDIAGWTNAGYNDGSWSSASEKGTPPCSPWNALVKRPIPQWKNSGLQEYANQASLPATSSGETIIAKLPYNAQVTAYLRIDAPSAGQTIDIRTDNFEGGGLGPNVMATYTTKAGVQEYEALCWINGHDVRYTIPSGITITSLKYRETGYNCDFVPAFSCNDDAINTLCTKAQRTVYVNMRDNYMDCPDRERAQWIADAALEICIAGYAFDTSAYALAHKAYSNLVQWNKTGGVLFSPVPAGNWTDELPMQLMYSTGWYGAWRHYMNSGDRALLEEMYPIVTAYLLTKYTMSGGLVNHRSGDWDWEDWGENADAAVLDNAWYYLALKSIKAMAGVLGITGDLAEINNRMTSIESNFDQAFWNGSAYVGDMEDDRANALAVLSGLAPASRYPAVRSVLTSLTQASPFLEKHVLEALWKMGYGGDAITRMKQRYGDMISENLTTLWEGWDHSGVNTYNHGWAGGAIVVLAECAAGIAPDSAGYDVFHVLPSMATLETISQEVETRHGRISASFSKQSDGFSMLVTVPEGTQATLGVPATFDNGNSVGLVKANGTNIWPSGTLAGIAFDSEESGYVRFTAQPGTWTLETGSAPPVRGKIAQSTNAGKRAQLLIRTSAGAALMRIPLPASAASVQLTFYSIAGRIIQTRDVHADNAGYFTADMGKELAPGSYLVRIQTTDLDSSFPLALVR